MTLITRTRRVRESQYEIQLFRSRAFAGFAFILTCLTLLCVRFFYLQITKYEEFQSKSDANRIYLRSIPPARGLIYDRKGRLLADNVQAFRLEVVPEQSKNLDEMFSQLREIVSLSEEDIQRFHTLRKTKRAYQGIPLRLRLSENEVARFALDRARFPGVEVVPYLTRYYPYGAEFAHLVGYVGRIDAADEEKLNESLYAGTTHIGKTGIERYYEEKLHGTPGYEQVEKNADGRALRVLDRTSALPGQNLFLSIDAEFQEKVEAAFEDKPGAAVAIDPRNGEILAMVSVPNFDPNAFVNGVSHVDYQALLQAPHRPLFNRALVGTYEPGSTMKPFIGLAGLELGVRTASDTILSSGEFFIPGQARGYRDWRAGGHGRVDLVESLAQSVNTYFYSLALEIGIDRMSDYLQQFGFGSPTGIDLMGEGRGILPSREWKSAMYGKPWFPGETVIAGIGQGFWVVTPLQLANAVSILAAGGESHPVHLLKATQKGFNAPIVDHPLDPSKTSFIKNREDWEIIRKGMIAVVNSPTGTAIKISEGCSYVIAGKTGTAQRYSRGSDGESAASALSDGQKHQALFIAFAPAENPRIALSLILEFGSSGSHDAAPIARKILDAYLNDNQAPSHSNT